MGKNKLSVFTSFPNGNILDSETKINFNHHNAAIKLSRISVLKVYIE